MIGLDTNVLIRYIAQDDPAQAATAASIIESLTVESPGFVTVVSIVEIVWVLKSCYKSSKAEIIRVLETLLRTQVIVVERTEVVWQAIRRYSEASADFADCLIERSAHAANCEYVITFDSNAAKTAGMRLI